MSHSNSSLNCFANCMAKYEHNYILNTPSCLPPSPHLTFGTMAHEVLCKAGTLRDEIRDNVVNPDEYLSIIPSEVLYQELKDYFNIPVWYEYFVPIIKQLAEYEHNLCCSISNKQYTIERELRLQLTPQEVWEKSNRLIKQPLVGVIDCLIRSENEAIILDYKFSTKRKEQDDFDLNSQLPLYAYLVNQIYGISVRNIRVGYIDIPKQSFERPALLKNGTWSRSKGQNCSQEMYKKAVEELHGDNPYYNCEPGGYYNECYECMALNKAAYMNVQYLDYEMYKGTINDLLNAAEMIDKMTEAKMPFLKKYDAYSCKACEFKNACKPWLNIDFEGE